jgi:hypothetical protein
MSITVQNTGAQTAPPTSPPLVTPGAASPTAGLEFEKSQVATVVTKISGATSVDSFDQVISIDDRIRVVGEFKVVGVDFSVAKDGSIVRTQKVAPCGDLVLVPWDPSDPSDQGIVRARP